MPHVQRQASIVAASSFATLARRRAHDQESRTHFVFTVSHSSETAPSLFRRQQTRPNIEHRNMTIPSNILQEPPD